jgi:hypothetical protein
VATRTSRRVKAEGEDLTTEDTENTEWDTKGVERVTWFTKVGADRRDALFLRRSLLG